MPEFKRYFTSAPEAALHPKVRFWQSMQRNGARLVCEVIRERDFLSFGPASLAISFLDAAGTDLQSPDEIEWDSRLNDELLRLGVRAVSPENEIRRFGLVLRDRLAEPEERFGDGYFNAVLIEYLEGSPFAALPMIAEKLASISTYRASRDGRAYEECSDAIEAVFVRCARDLTALDYEQADAIDILSAALATYLDERFSITTRKLLGFDDAPRAGG